MTATLETPHPLARKSSVFHDLRTVAKRACRGVFREPEFFIPALLVPVFFYVVNVGALQDFAEQSGTVDDFKAFQLPVSIIFAVTGISRASALVTDIQGGYFDRLLLTPIRRPALLLGLMVADLMAVIMLAIPVLMLGLLLGGMRGRQTVRRYTPAHSRARRGGRRHREDATCLKPEYPRLF